MSLVPEHIDEAIKHLSPKTEEEVIAAMMKLPLHERFPFANNHKIKLSQPIIKEIKYAIRDLVPKYNKMIKAEVKRINKKYSLELPIYKDREFDLLTSTFTTYLSSPSSTVGYEEPMSLGILSPVFKEITLEHQYIIFPEAGFKIMLTYNWTYEKEKGSNGHTVKFEYNDEGKLLFK